MANGIIYRFVPRIYDENKTMKALNDSQHDEMMSVIAMEREVFFNTFVDTATEVGIERFERLLGIMPHSSQTLEDRREMVRKTLASRLPYTKITVREWLDFLVGTGNYSFLIDPDRYIVTVDIDFVEPNVYREVLRRLRRLIPANMILNISADTPYTHRYLERYRHVGLGSFTFAELEQMIWSELEQKTWADLEKTEPSMRDFTHEELSGED